MKNIKLIIALFTIGALWGCDPLGDDIDKLNKEYAYSQDVEYTLTDDDYDDLDLGSGFQSEDDAKTMIPGLLADIFPALGKTSTALVTYNIDNSSLPYLGGENFVTTVSGQEYQDLGFTFGNFNNADADVATYANFKYPNAKDGDYADITFDYYDGSFHGGAMSRVVYTDTNGWQYAFILPDAVYGDFFGESGIDFSDREEGEEKVPAYLNYLLSLASDYNELNVEEGKSLTVQYNFDDRCFGDECEDPGQPNVPAIGVYTFDGASWVSNKLAAHSLSFGHDGTTWVPDNTIKYSITSSDFSAIAANEDLGDAAARDNLAQYGNFNRSNWSDDDIFESVSFILKTNFPASEVGQKYLVTYNTYPDGDLSIHVILNDTGEYEFVPGE